MTRTAVKQLMGSSKEGIFDDGEKQEDKANKNAQEAAKKHHEKYKSDY